MNIVIDCLKKELERQNLLIMSNKWDKQNRLDFPGIKAEAPLIEEVYPKMEQFRDELENAIILLETYLMAKS